jgi:hypothetical protein
MNERRGGNDAKTENGDKSMRANDAARFIGASLFLYFSYLLPPPPLSLGGVSFLVGRQMRGMVFRKSHSISSDKNNTQVVVA